MRSHNTDRTSTRQVQPEPISAETYRRWLTRARGSGGYFTFDRAYYGIVKNKLDALFLQDLLNLATLRNTPYEDGMFLCTVEYLKRGSWTVDEQRARLEALRKKGYLRTEKRGLPPCRWVEIDIEAIERALDLVDSQSRANAREQSRANGRVKKKTPTESSNDPKNCRPNAAAQRIGTTTKEEDSMTGTGLLDIPVKTEGLAPTPEDYENANKLHAAVAGKTNLQRRWSRSTWAKQLAMLRQEVGNARMIPVLIWYCANIKGEYVPESFCGESFRKKFPRIEAAMNRDRKQNPEVTITPATEGAFKRLRCLGWPKGTEAQLKTFVQLSTDRMRQFRDRLGKLLHSEMHDCSLVATTLVKHLDHAPALAEAWGHTVHARIANWKDFNGNLIPFAWDVSKPECRAELCGVVERKFGSRKPFDRIMKEIG